MDQCNFACLFNNINNHEDVAFIVEKIDEAANWQWWIKIEYEYQLDTQFNLNDSIFIYLKFFRRIYVLREFRIKFEQFLINRSI